MRKDWYVIVRIPGVLEGKHHEEDAALGSSKVIPQNETRNCQNRITAHNIPNSSRDDALTAPSTGM
jgi:hypothetical protein